ncbi:unnamed protein product [Amoebophrya sp. A25]|nr:unnamed protein product [Amoebophrya sp. A25]|eukprot:GSA25T00023439001.1
MRPTRSKMEYKMTSSTLSISTYFAWKKNYLLLPRLFFSLERPLLGELQPLNLVEQERLPLPDRLLRPFFIR